MLFDTHFHLDLFNDNTELLRELEQRKIYTIAVTNLPKVFSHTEKLCQDLKYVKPALGYHPELASKHNNQIPLFKELSERTRYIGEIGLDNLRKTVQDFSDQKRIFEQVIDICAEKENKVLTIHSRRAEKEVISMVGDNFPGKVILHWYSGSLRELEIALSFGFYFSVNYNMTQSANGRNIINALPKEKILLETDGPFTSYKGSYFSPILTGLICNEIIKIREKKDEKKISMESLYTNFKSLLSK